MKKVIIALLKFYQKTLSPDHGWFKYYHPQGYCRFQPSCSQYMIDSIERQGVIVGTVKGVWRVLRCNPYSKGGYDPAK